jgi:hypothetical protein
VAGIERGDVRLGKLGRLGELGLSQSTIGWRSRSNIQSASPSVHMFLQRSASLLPRPNGFTASSVSCEMLKWTTCHLRGCRPRAGSARSRLGEVARGELALVGDDEAAFAQRSTFTFSAAGFIAISTSGWSPAVSIAVEPKLIWKAETPKVVPCGARISRGNRGRSQDRCRPEPWTSELPAGQLHPVAGIAGEAHTTASGGGWGGRFFSVTRCVAVAMGRLV